MAGEDAEPSIMAPGVDPGGYPLEHHPLTSDDLALHNGDYSPERQISLPTDLGDAELVEQTHPVGEGLLGELESREGRDGEPGQGVE